METDRRRLFTRYAILGLFVVGVLALVIWLDEVFGPLLFALLLAYILNPVVNWIQKFTKLPRGAGMVRSRRPEWPDRIRTTPRSLVPATDGPPANRSRSPSPSQSAIDGFAQPQAASPGPCGPQ